MSEKMLKIIQELKKNYNSKPKNSTIAYIKKNNV